MHKFCALGKIPLSALMLFGHNQQVNGCIGSPVLEFQSRYIKHHKSKNKDPTGFGVSIYRLSFSGKTTE